MPIKPLPASASVENLKKQAKSLLKKIQSSEPAAISRLKPYFSNTSKISLQDVQLIIAREHGFTSWVTLMDHVKNNNSASELSLDQLANDFLRNVVVVYSETESANPDRFNHAAELLVQHPEILTNSIHTAAAIGDVEQIKRLLDDDPALINRKGGYHHWEPIMYAAYARLPMNSTLEVVKKLLQRGADPNAHYMWGGQYKFTALTGVFGQGEAGPINLPQHPDYEAFARLLLSAGANPNDSQAAYNRMFEDDNSCLELLLEFGIAQADKNNWLLHENDKLVPHSQETLRYQMSHAISTGKVDRVKLLTSSGLDLNDRGNERTFYQIARLHDQDQIAQYLLDQGAEQIELEEIDAFKLALLQPNRSRVNDMLEKK